MPRSGCLTIKPDRHQQQQPRDQEVERAQLAFAALEPPREHQRHRDLHDLARLDHTPTLSQRVAPFFGRCRTARSRSAARRRRCRAAPRSASACCGDTCATTNSTPSGEQHVARVVDEARAVSRSRPSTSSPGRAPPAAATARPAGRRSRSRSAAARCQSEGLSKTALIGGAHGLGAGGGASSRSGDRGRRPTPSTVLPFSGTASIGRGVPIGAVDWPWRVAAMSASLGYWPEST